MKRKIILLISMLLFTCGCTAEYNLTIDDLESHTFKEHATIKSEDKRSIASVYENPWPIASYFDAEYISESPEKIEGVEYYKITSSKKNKWYQVDFDYQFPSSEFQRASSVHAICKNFKKTYNEEEDTTTIDTGNCNIEKYLDLEKLIIHVTINNEVLAHNAMSVEENVYTWSFKPNELNPTRMLLSYKNKNETEKQEAEKKEKIKLLLALFVMFLIFIVAIIYMKKNPNK